MEQTHDVLGTSFTPPYPDGLERAIVAMGCFWGAERTATAASAERASPARSA